MWHDLALKSYNEKWLPHVRGREDEDSVDWTPLFCFEPDIY